VSVGRVQMIVGRVGTARRAEAIAIDLRHAAGNRRVIFDDMAVAVDDFVFLSVHVLSPFFVCHSEGKAEESRSHKCEILRYRSG